MRPETQGSLIGIRFPWFRRASRKVAHAVCDLFIDWERVEPVHLGQRLQAPSANRPRAGCQCPQPELAHGDHRDGHASGGSRKGALLLDGDEDGGVGER